jgi:TolB-like protein
MKKIIIFITFLLWGVFAFAQTSTKTTVVVVPFDLKGVPQDEGDVLFEVFQSEFANTGKAKIVDRTSLEKIKKQQEFENSDWSNADKIAEMGKALNASMVVTGQIMMFKSNLVTTIKLIDVNTTEIISSVVEKTTSTDDLFTKIPDMAKKLAKNLSLTGLGKLYEIGDIGPGGGIVFYVDENGFKIAGDDKTYHYLECSKEIVGTISWCPCTECTPITQTGFGFGKLNTKNITKIKSHTKTHYKNGKVIDTDYLTISISNCAAWLCVYYTTPTTSSYEWWLPSRDELDLIYKNLKKKGFISDENWFWSSSSYSHSYAWSQRFSDGYQDYSTKSNTRSVRAIRAF